MLKFIGSALDLASTVVQWLFSRWRADQEQPIKDRQQQQNEVDRQNEIADVIKNQDVDKTRDILSE